MAIDEGMRTPGVGAASVCVSRIETAQSVAHICEWYFQE